MFHTLDETTMERYLAVFQKVFVGMRHTNHSTNANFSVSHGARPTAFPPSR